jgi:putative transcriptional regulator
VIVFVDILELLRKNGWSGYRLQKAGLISNGTIVRLRHRQSISTETLDTICRLCNCQPGDLMRWEPDPEE